MAKLPKSNLFLSIIILNFNSGNYLKNCLESINQSTLGQSFYEIIIVDNDSTDESIKNTQTLKIDNCHFFHNINNGFAAGNNFGVKHLSKLSTHVLFLNPDTTVEKVTLEKMMGYFKNNSNVDAATCKITLAATGKIQPECHRDFPTPLNAFLHFSGISSRAYFMEYLDYSKPQKINACLGAFLMIKKDVGEKIKWWCQDYFMYGEDIDLCYQIKNNKYQLWYTPITSITHYWGISSGLKNTKSAASRETKIRSARASTEAMKIFYKRNLNYNFVVTLFVNLGINFIENIRVFKAAYL